ncbi:MAG TPA: hypothetical protein DDY82_01505 [Clostridiales bacterium]|nr:hypothetical protein [Clostridiales bacterium]HBJ97733.1 hypothetical protein [Clostridiales bacterium]
MTVLNEKVLEQYKKLDNLCGQIYGDGKAGVTAYIKEMEKPDYDNLKDNSEWRNTLKKLKSIRHCRNLIFHDCNYDYDTEIFSEEDLNWIKEFYSSILSGKDALSKARPIKEYHANFNERNKAYGYYYETSRVKKEPTFLQKIGKTIRKIFCCD